nr:unnamed protein product [Digitaria exilis]
MSYWLAMPTASGESRIKKLLVQHIETVHHSEAVEDVLHSLLLADSNSKEKKSKTKEWNDRIKQDKKPDQLRSAGRQRHEYLPSAAEEIESDIISLALSEDSEVYDIYTVKEVNDTNMEDTSAASYPRLQVDDSEDECYDDDYPYDTDDSNAEDNPLFDYPEELSEYEDDGSNDEDPFGDVEGSGSEDYEKEEVETDGD